MAITQRDAQFRADMMRCRGIEFAKLGIMVEIDGENGIRESA